MKNQLISQSSQSKELLLELHDIYERSPLFKGLIQLIPYAGIPEAMVNAYANRLRNKKYRTFFEQLNDGKFELTEEMIASDDFLNAYFSTVNYVLRSRSDFKFKAFAEILKCLATAKINGNEHEDYSKIFDDLTEREFVILAIKHDFELLHKDVHPELNPLQRTSIYWEQFKRTVFKRIDIGENELQSMLIRIQRTGCYLKFTGYFDESTDQVGDTTEIFSTLKKIIGLSIN
jgi:hypothetical protein